MSDTPLTDAQERFIITPPPTDKKEGYVPSAFCRKLERELNALKRKLEERK